MRSIDMKRLRSKQVKRLELSTKLAIRINKLFDIIEKQEQNGKRI